MFPKRTFITFINEKYQGLVERLIGSVELFSEYPIIVYTFNFDLKITSTKCFIKRLDDFKLNTPVFTNLDQTNDGIGIVERGDFNTYYTLSRKQTIILDALNNGLEEGIFLDADGIVRENIDESFEYLKECENYPLVGKGLFEYMMLYGKGDPSTGNPLEMPMMNLLGIHNRSMHYVQTNFMVFNKDCKEFFEECVKISNNKNILNHNLLYAPYHDETIINVLLWKRNAKKQLPLIHFNLMNFEALVNFYDTKLTGIKVNGSPWQVIPENKNDIKYFHGCKSISELDKCLDYLTKNKIEFIPHVVKNFQKNKNKKICIVTLYDKNYEELAKMSIPNKLEYAKHCGYDVIYFDKVLDKSRPPQWSKVKSIQYALEQNYDWVWWIDIDALIMEFSIKLESIIDENFDIIFTSNKYSYLSNGSSFFKNTELTKNFLNECYSLDKDYLKNIDVKVFDHEQQSMRLLLLNDPIYKQKIKLIDERICNSYCTTNNHSVLSAYPNWNSEPNIYKKGDFVIQFCGRNFEERLEIYKEYIQHVKYMSDDLIVIKNNSILEKSCKFQNQDILLIDKVSLNPQLLNLTTYFIKSDTEFFDKKSLISDFCKDLGYKNINIFE